MSDTTKKVIVFLLTFFSYAGLHFLREGWSYSKPQLQKLQKSPVTQAQLGLIDTLYLFSYSIGMVTTGNFSSRMNLKYFIGIGMVLASISYMSFSFLFVFSGQFYYAFVVVMMCINGFFQSTGWPGVMGVIGNWFGKQKRGLLLGFWAVNANVGNIIALVLLNILKNESLNWTYNFIVTGCLCLFIAGLVLIFLKQKPEEEQQKETLVKPVNQVQNQVQNESILTLQDKQQSQKDQQKQQKKINILSVLFLPRVPLYAISYACLKGCIYGLLFWLPTYLTNHELQKQDGYISSMCDVGTFIGGMGVGYLGDRYSYRALFLSPFLFLSAAIMFIVSFALTNVAWTYYLSMLLIGVFIGGPYNIIGTAITIDIGEQIGKKNISTVSAFIEGSAAVFAALSQMLISIMPAGGMFYLFSGECLVSALALLPLFFKDLKEFRAKA